MNSKDGVLIRAVDMTKVRDRLVTSLAKPQFKQLYSNPADALKDLGRYMENITQINPIDSATLLGGGEKGAKKRNLFYETLGFRLRNGESLVNAPESIINKSQDTIKSYRAERFAKLVNSGHAFAFEEATTYERAMRNFQPDAFTKETLPAGETLTNPDGYRILKKTGSKLFRVYDDKGELIGTTSTEQSAMMKGQADFIKKSAKEEKRFQPDKLTASEIEAAKKIARSPSVGLFGKIPSVVFRGETEKSGTNAFLLGKGLYTTTSKKQAKEYGIVRSIASTDAVPSAPLFFDSMSSFESFLNFLKYDVLGLKRASEFEQKYGSDIAIVLKQIYPNSDGVQIGSGNGAFFVKWLNQDQTRFQPDPASPNILVDSKGNRIIKSASGKYRVYNMAGALLGVRESEQSAIKLATK